MIVDAHAEAVGEGILHRQLPASGHEPEGGDGHESGRKLGVVDDTEVERSADEVGFPGGRRQEG